MTALPTRIVLTYPGQGGYSPGLLARLSARPAAAGIIDRVRAAWVTETGQDLAGEWSRPDCGLDDLARAGFGATQVTIFAAGLAAHATVREAVRGSVTHLGHSFGELTALTAAEAWSIEDGVRAVAARVRALATCDPGAMAAVSADSTRVGGLATALGDQSFAIAGHTGPGQVVVAGPVGSLERFERAASALGMPTTRLVSPYAFHSPVLAAARAGFADALRALATRMPAEPVHSAILGRDLTAGDDLPTVLADALVDPFDLGAAARCLHARGASVFIECGGRSALTGAVQRALRAAASGRPWVAVPVDDGSDSPAAAAIRAVEQVQRELVEIPAIPDDLVQGLRHALRSDLADMTARLLAELAALPAADRRTNGHGHAHASGGPRAAAAAATAPPDEPVVDVRPLVGQTATAAGGRSAVLADLVAMYAEALEYPAEVLEEGIELEGDLGVDSVKQTELLARTAERFALPTAPADLSIGELRTLGDIADLVMRTRAVPVG